MNNLRLVQNTSNTDKSAAQLIADEKCSAALDDTAEATSLQSGGILRHHLGPAVQRIGRLGVRGCITCGRHWPASPCRTCRCALLGAIHGGDRPCSGRPDRGRHRLPRCCRGPAAHHPGCKGTVHAGPAGHGQLRLQRGDHSAAPGLRPDRDWWSRSTVPGRRTVPSSSRWKRCRRRNSTPALPAGKYTIALAPIRAEGGSVYQMLQQFTAGERQSDRSHPTRSMPGPWLRAPSRPAPPAVPAAGANVSASCWKAAPWCRWLAQQKRLLVADGVERTGVRPLHPGAGPDLRPRKTDPTVFGAIRS